MKIAIGVPNAIDSPHWNGFITGFRDINTALAPHERVVFAPSGGDVRLEAELRDPAEPMNQYQNTRALSLDFARKVGRERPDAILAFTGMGVFLEQKHVFYTSNVPYKAVARLTEGEYPDTPHFRKLAAYYRFVGHAEKENYEKAERIIVLSRKIQELIVSEHGIDRNKITYVPRPVPRLHPGPASAEKNAGKMRVILMPAELRVMKGIRYAIETMKFMKKAVPDAVLIICGRVNNYEREYIEALLAAAKGKANIIVAGFIPREQFYGYMRMAECAFMPFCFDECPVSLSECIAHGLPVVTNEYAGFDSAVINTFGHCAGYKDVGDYAGALERMLCDGDYRKRKAEGAREVAGRFTFEAYKEAVNGVFQGL